MEQVCIGGLKRHLYLGQPKCVRCGEIRQARPQSFETKISSTNDPYVAGYEAVLAGRMINPHEIGTEKATLWQRGFEDGVLDAVQTRRIA